MPFTYCGTTLSLSELTDELRLRHKLPLVDNPTQYDGCTAKFSVSYSLSFEVRGLVKTRYNENRDTIGCMACSGFQPSNIHNEPIIYLCYVTNELKDDASSISMEVQDRGDLLVRGFWDQHTDSVIDLRVCNADQLSCLNRKPISILKTAENNKKKKHLDVCLEQRQHFTPFVVLCQGLFGKEASFL